jgi:hypothetical protein
MKTSDARLTDLRENDFVYAECKCGRNDLLTRGMPKQMGMQPDDKLVEFGARRRRPCERCRQRGLATVSIRWAE